MNGSIYVLTCSVNGKQYVGQTRKSINTRMRGHRYDSKHIDSKLYRAIRKHGWEVFSYEVLREGIETLLELNALEIFYIDNLDTYHHGYNSTTGGEGTKSCVPSVETLKRQSESHIGKTGAKCPNSKPVAQVCPDTHKVLAVFEGASDAYRKTGIHNVNISSCARGVRPLAGGFYWQYI